MNRIKHICIIFALIALTSGCNKDKQAPAPAADPDTVSSAQTAPADAATADSNTAPNIEISKADSDTKEIAENSENKVENSENKAEKDEDAAAKPEIQKIKNTKKWAKIPDPTQGKQCKEGNCKCGTGHCAKDAYCINDNCYCTGKKPPFRHDDTYIQSNDFGTFTCDLTDGVQFYCEDDDLIDDGVYKGCTSDNGIKVEHGTGTSVPELQKSVSDSVLLELCGRKSAENFKRDISPFLRFTDELSKKSVPDECKQREDEWDTNDSLDKDCLFKSKQEFERCEIRRACDSWYIPRQYRDQYVCEFEAGIHKGATHNESYYYPKAKGLKCIEDSGCVCTNVKIAKDEYCNSVPEYGYPIDSDMSGQNTDPKPERKTFVDKSNLKWDSVKDSFTKPSYHGKGDISPDKFAQIMSSSFSPKDYPTKYGECTSSRAEISTKQYIELIQCNILNENDEHEKDSCDADGQTGYPIGLFLSIHDTEKNTIDVHAIGDVYSDCGLEYYWSNEYEYSLKYAYADSLGDTQALHAIVTKYSHNSDCDHERAVDGPDCREETVKGEDRHYIFAGDDNRLFGSYIENTLVKTVNGCYMPACGEFLNAELFESNLTLTGGKWQIDTNHWEMELAFSSDEELEKVREAALNGDFNDPKVLPQYEKYLNYASTDLEFSKDALKSFLEEKPANKQSGDIKKGTFSIDVDLD